MPQKSEQSCLNDIASVHSHITGSDLTFNSTTHLATNITHNNKTGPGAANYHADVVEYFMAAQVLKVRPSHGGSPTPVDGVLMVHLIEDADGTLFPLELFAGEGFPDGARFDAVGDSTLGTTVTLDDSLLLFPGCYAQETQP